MFLSLKIQSDILIIMLSVFCPLACQEGYFGSNCSQVCSPSCKSDTCRHTDGWCNTCAADDNCYTGN